MMLQLQNLVELFML